MVIGLSILGSGGPFVVRMPRGWHRILSKTARLWPKPADSVSAFSPNFHWLVIFQLGVSENSVPLNPMVNDHYPYSMAISLGI